MVDILQRQLNFEGSGTNGSQLPPKGYKGLSGFHKYWGKKPTESWRFLIENLTKPGDIVLDPFLGSGLLAKECIDQNRRFVGFDVNPISIELAKLFLHLPQYRDLLKALDSIENSVKSIINDMYILADGNIVTHFLWDDNRITKVWTKRGRNRIELYPDSDEIERLQQIKSYMTTKLGNLRLFDNSRINSKKDFTVSDLFSPRALRAIELIKTETEKFSGCTKRALYLILSSSLGQMSKMVFAVSKRGRTKDNEVNKIEVGSWVIGYWRPKQHFEVNAWNCYRNKANKLLKAINEVGQMNGVDVSSNFAHLHKKGDQAYVKVGDSELLLKEIPSGTIKVVLTDPPHGDRIPYLELSEMWNSVIGLDSKYEDELVVSNAKGRHKDLFKYNKKLSCIFDECSRVLENDGLLAVMFNARSENHWDSLRGLENSTGLEYLGCYPLEYSARSVVQDNRKGGLKTDFVLVYGKNASETLRTDINDTFCNVNKWTNKYPKKGC